MASGEKDTLSLSVQGFPAITTGGESVYYRPETINHLSSRFDFIGIIGDMDPDGIKYAVKKERRYSGYNA